MPAIDEILPQSTPQNDVQHSFRRFLKLDVGGRGHLLRILGVGFGLAVGVGNTIGTGILRTPGEVAGYLGMASWSLRFGSSEESMHSCAAVP